MLKTLRFNELSKAQKQHWKDSTEGRLTTMKWKGAANKRLPRSVSMKLRTAVTAQDETSAETAERIGEFLGSINEGSRKCRRSAFEENYEKRLATAADWELSSSNLVRHPLPVRAAILLRVMRGYCRRARTSRPVLLKSQLKIKQNWCGLSR